MATEKIGGHNDDPKPAETHQIHPTHFPVIKIPLKDTGHNSSYEWVDLGNGCQKRVPKKTEKSGAEDVSRTHI